MTSTTPTTNSVPNSSFLRGMTDDEIRAEVAKVGPQLIARAFPGSSVEAKDLDGALVEANAAFIVEKHPLLAVNCPEGIDNPNAPITPVTSHVATVRTDSNATLGIVGKDYGIVQTRDAMGALDILAGRGDVEIRNVEQIGGGSRVRVTALLGTTEFPSMDGAPNTLGHFGVFEATHDGSAHTTASLFTLRVECFNGMTSKSIVKTHKLRHTSKVGERVDAMTQDILAELIGDVEAEKAFFLSLIDKRMSRSEFSGFATDLLGGEPTNDPEAEEYSQSKRTRFENQLNELCGYFEGGCQGAGETAWGAYNSVTRWVEAKREGIEDAVKAAKKFESNVNGDGQSKIQKAVRLLQKRDGTVVPEPTKAERRLGAYLR